MTPEDIQDLRWMVENPEWDDVEQLRAALPQLLDDWNRMHNLLKEVAASGVVYRHHAGKYYEIQLNGTAWEKVKEIT